MRLRDYHRDAGAQIAFAICVFLLFAVAGSASPIDSELERRLGVLAEQNEQLQQQLREQAEVIRSLTNRLSSLERSTSDGDKPSEPHSAGSLSGVLSSSARINISGQLAAGYFKTGSEGEFPNGEFRVDEARVFLDARSWQDLYGYVELNVITRESDENVHLGEAYLELENVLKWRGLDALINLRAGRFFIPFGEEYQVRYPIDDPLITHSLTDLWGVDEGVEVYGSHGPFQYAFAIQNGGHSGLRDFTSDKSFAGRIALEPVKWLRLSASAMRTGDLSTQDDQLSEMWFGNGFFRSLGSTATTQFGADLVEGDVQVLLPRGHLKAAGGAIRYKDNDPFGDNERHAFYYFGEGMFRFTKQFYGAARFSQIFAEQGMPIVGLGTWGDYFYAGLTKNLWRASVGAGYTPDPHFVFKIEYAIERGATISGGTRDHEDFFGAQAVIRF